MDRAIRGFDQDAAGDWVATLACGHRRHVRHDPPFRESAWVASAEGRAGRLGTALACNRCDRLELPEGYALHRATRTFDEHSVPDALLRTHTTRAGVWALIRVEQGALEYHLHAPFERMQRVTPEAPGVVPPEVEHHVACPEPVRFHVDFWSAADGRPRS